MGDHRCHVTVVITDVGEGRAVSDMHVLLVHGFGGSGPWHWQQWLSGRLAERDVSCELPALPDQDHPELDRWLAVLRARLDSVPAEDELVVAAHSCGAALWLHHAATIAGRARRADRVLLVSPPGPDWRHPDVRGVAPYPVDAHALRRAAGSTRLVIGSGDPYLSVQDGHWLAETLRVEMDVLPDGEHLNTDAGYGPWPAVLRWTLHGSTPLADRFETEPNTFGASSGAFRLV
nr:alpha/beta hydrolase [Actinopolyspora halophila]